MTHRNPPLVVDQIYHVFNRSIARQPIFLTKLDYQRALEVFTFYSFLNPPLRYSHYNRLPLSQKNDFWKKLEQGPKQIKLLAFCLMPNHLHFLIKEMVDRGISTFMSNLQNSYAKYFNLKNDRSGSLFQTMFKAKRIETQEQLIHISRYIHLNPVTSYILEDIEELNNYPWSSFPIYTGKQGSNIIDTELVMSLFSSVDKFISFTKDQVNYQRKLNEIKHLTLE